MFGVCAKPRRKQNAKISRSKAKAKAPTPTPASTNYQLTLSAIAELDSSPPPPYALVCPPLRNCPPPPDRRRKKQSPVASPPKPSAWSSRPVIRTRPRNVTPAAALPVPVSKTPRYSHQPIGNSTDQWQERCMQQAAEGALCDQIFSKFEAVITSIDGEEFGGQEEDLELDTRETSQPGIRGGGGWGLTSREVSRGANKAITSAVTRTNYFAKANLYTNSKLPPNLPPLKLYIRSYPLLCLAAQYSQRAYTRPVGEEREAFVNADWRMGTKAMVIKSVPVDDMNCVVFAIRGSQTFMDWAINLDSAPVAPTDFLDDPGNFCHAGFLSVARKMIKPVAARLRSLLEEDPSRTTCSLLMTGHSAGGAVASLLFAHMLAESARSELNILTGCFKRIHCLTFGTPPISLLPLTKPTKLRYKKSLFMSFINEGDPVPRADRAYIRSLVKLYASPAPGSSCIASIRRLKPTKRLIPRRANSAPAAAAPVYIWEVPAGTLSNAGRLVVLRENPNSGAGFTDDVKAEITSDQELRGVVFGDPVMHMMKVYARRVEVLATKAVTAKIWG